MSRSVCLIVTAEVTALTFYKGFVRFLVDHGWMVTVIAASSGKLEPWATGEGGRGLAVDFRRDPAPWPDLQALLKTFWLLRRLRPDVVLCATPKAGLVGTLAAWLARVPVRIYDLWGLRLETEHGARRALLALLERVAMAAATQVWANSRSLAAAATRMGLAGGKTIRVLGAGSSHGVDTEYFRRDVVAARPIEVEELRRANPTALILGFIGRLHRDKGVLDLLAATRRCADDGVDVRLVVVGDPEDPATVRGVDDAVSRGLAVWATGVTDVRPYLAAIDVLCLPTYREGFPNVVLEAAAMGVPAIVTDATGAIDSVVDGQTGWVTPTHDPTSLARLLSTMAADQSDIERRGLAAFGRVRSDYRRETVFDLKLETLATAQA